MILGRLFAPRAALLQNPEGWQELFGPGTNSNAGEVVTAATAMRVSTVFACTRVIAETIATLPFGLYRRVGDRIEPQRQNRLFSLVHDTPNVDMTSVDLFETSTAGLCLRGRAFSRIYRTKGGEIGEIVPLNPAEIVMDRTASGALVYVQTGGPTLTAAEVWRVNGFGTDGLVGLSPIGQLREAIGMVMAMERHGSALFRNGARPGGLLTTENVLKPDVREALRKNWDEKYQGAANRGKTAVLEQGLKFQAIGMTSEDSQFLETRKFQRTDICGAYRVPPHMIGDLERATFSNIEHQDLAFAKHTIRPYLVRFEKSAGRDLLTPVQRKEGFFFKFNIEGLLRGDTASRTQYYREMFGIGALSQNEIRAKEDEPPIDNGDAYYVPANMINTNSAAPAEGEE